MRWFCAPPQRVAYFCAVRRPGSVLRVSRMRQEVPAMASTKRRVAVAVPDSSLQEIQCDALAREQRARGALDVRERGAGADRVAVVGLPRDADAGIELAEGLVGPVAAAEDRILAADDLAGDALFGRHQRRGDVAAAQIFGERRPHLRAEVGGQGREVGKPRRR
jgi:hypothetical protein